MDQDHKTRERSFIRELVPDWRRPRAQALRATRTAIVVIVTLLGVILLPYVIGLLFGKPVWEVLRVLILPAALALGGIYFAERRTAIDREIARRHAEDGELRTYFEQMGKLLLGQDTPNGIRLRESEADSDIRYLARAWTTSTLEKLTGEYRKRRLLRFLYESHLIDKGKSVVSLKRARLQEVNLEDAILTEADLSGAWLDNAKLGNANLRGADLSGANLSGANLKGADLTGTNLTDAKVSQKQLDKVESLKGATMPNGQKYEEWLKSKGR